MRTDVVMDTNVAVVANGAASHAGPDCEDACLNALEFPEDSDLADFDWNDRKFVAVACAAGTSPPILNASDTDWLRHHEALGRHGVRVNFLCPELMRRNGRRAAGGRRSSRSRSAASTDR